MDSVNNSMENDELLLDNCMEDYVKEVIKQGITTINQDHILECCNGTSVNNCTIQKDVEEQMDGDMFRFVTEGVILTMVSTFGFIGNAMSVIVLTRTATGLSGGLSSSASFSNLLRGLAVFDALFLLSAILSFGLPNVSSWYTENVFLGGICIMRALFGLIHTFRIGSVYMTLAVTFERFHAIIFPLRHFSWKKFLIPISVAIAILYNIPKFFELELTVNEKNQTLISETELRKNTIYVNVYVVWSKIIFIEIIPYIAIVIMNIFIITKITKSTRFRRKFQRQYPDQETIAGVTAETNLSHNGRRVGKAVSQRIPSLRQDDSSMIPINSTNVEHQGREKCTNQDQDTSVNSDTKSVEKQQVEKGTEKCYDNQPLLRNAKPSIEIDSPTKSDHNSKENDETLEGSQNGPDGFENSTSRSVNHAENSLKKSGCQQVKSSLSTKYLGFSEDGGGSSKRSQSETKTFLNKTKKTKVQKKHFLRKQQEEHSLGIILILMSILFVICQSLKIVPDMYEIIVCKPAAQEHKTSSEQCLFPPIINQLTQISHLLVCINSAANFLIYYCAGAKFREAWLNTFGFWWCCCSRKDLKKLVMVPFRRRNNQSARSSNIDIDHDSSQEMAMTPQSGKQTIQMSPMGNSTRNDSLFGNNYRRKNSSDFVSKNENKNESTKKIVSSEI